jgi:hypothetical protein
MIRHALPIACASVLLTACGTPSNLSAPQSGPPGAPSPTDIRQELVDLEGCRWYVVGTDKGFIWEKLQGFRSDCDTGSSVRSAPLPPPVPSDPHEAEAAELEIESAAENTQTATAEIENPAPEAPKPTDISIAALEETEANAAPLASEEAVAQGLYIQAATFRSSTNAKLAEQRIRNLELPFKSREQIADTEFQKVIVGPFESKEARLEALKTLRNNGFPDAYLLVL